MGSHDATLFGPEAELASPAAQASVNPLGLARGTTIGRYVVVEKLGHGGMGVVYAAYDPKLDRKIAFKLLHSRKTPRSTEARQEKQDRLLREAQALARIAHANVIAVHDVGTFEGHIFVAMEYLEGQDLQDYADTKPGWEAILRAYVSAGRGLEAAHHAGLVHRDFKPENAFRCTDGRVKVLDFGLAHLSQPEFLDTRDEQAGPSDPSGEAESTRTQSGHASRPATSLEEEGASGGSLSIRMTKPGALLGTPAFMPPEQWEGTETDARSDQFSFCAALYEGLYGERPFPGDTVASLAFNIQRGNLKDPPAGSDVPTWLRRAIVRGLEVDPAKRWPSMGELLAELERDRSAPRRRILGAVILSSLVAGIFAYNAHQDAQREAACQPGPEVDAMWSEDQQAAVARALEATRLSYAADTATLAQARLDAYAREWSESRRETCRATRVRKEQSEKVMDLRMACLDTRAAEFNALVEVLADADAKVVEKAGEAIAGLTPLESCEDTEALLFGVPPPSDAATADEVEAIRALIARSRSTRNAGRFAASEEQVGVALSRAEKIDYPPVRAEALLSRGQLRHDQGRYDEARADLGDAVWLATAHKHDRVALRGANSLVSLIGFTLSKPQEAQVWARHAEALVERSGGDPSQEAQLANGRGNLHLAQQQFEQARDYYLQVLAIRERHGGAHSDSLVGTYGNLGTTSIELGESERAREYFERALDLSKELLGPRHPSTAKSYNNLGIALERAGEYAAAIEHQTKALELKRELLGDEHPSVGGSLGNLANIHWRTGEFAESSRLYREAMGIFTKALGPAHPHVGRCHSGIGKAERRLENWDEAIAQLEAALEIFDDSEATARNLSATRFELAQALRGARREPSRALELASQSLAFLEAARAAGDKSASEGDIDETISKIEAFIAARSN